MSVDSNTDDLCCQLLNEYLFDKIWNEPSSECRINIKPNLYRKLSFTGSVSLTDGNLKLPTTNTSYYVYVIATDSIPALTSLQKGKWYSGTELCNTYQFMLNACTTDGSMLHKGSTYVYLNDSGTFIYLAVEKKMFKKCVPDNGILDLYIAFYFDSDHSDDTFYMESFKVSSSIMNSYYAQINTVLSKLKSNDQLLIYVNGEEVSDSVPSLKVGDYVDYIADRNIEASFTLSIANNDDDPVYLSTTDKQYKQLIHIPREYNSQNSIITYNTCDFFIKRANKNEHGGLYLQRASTPITQVTHNDMSIPLYVLDAYRDYLATQVIAIKVVIRKHNKDNVLIRDSNFIDLLYNEIHSDEDIIKILTGKKSTKDITWWTADHLEQSQYVKMMFDTPNVITLENMQTYVDTLGLYHTVELLCKRIVDTVVTDATGNSLTFRLPILYVNKSVTGILYIDGKYLSRKYYTTISDGSEISVSVDKSIALTPGQRLTLVLFLTDKNEIYTKKLTSIDNTITVPFKDVNVYVKKELTPLNYGQGLNETSQYSYQKLSLGANQYVLHTNNDGTTKIVFSADYVGKEVIVENTYCAYIRTYNLEEFTSVGKPIAIPLYSSVFGSDRLAPILEVPNVSVYLNNSYLVKDIDYTLHKVTDDKGNTCFYEVVVQTMDYFNEDESDNLDIIVNMAEEVDRSTGFVVNDISQDETPINLNFSNISLVHVAGKVEREGVFKGNYLKFEEGKYKNGSVCEVQTSVPAMITDYVASKTVSDEMNRITAMNEYFHPFNYKAPDKVVIEEKHRVYSVYLAKFIYEMLKGNIAISNDPDVNRMTEHIKKFDYIKDFDVCFTYKNNTYLEYYPQYVNYLTTPEIKQIIDKYIKRFMPENYAPSLESVYSQGE